MGAAEDPGGNRGPEEAFKGQSTASDGLFDNHRRELLDESAIHPDVIRQRGYRSIGRPTGPDPRPREQLKAIGIPGWAIAEDYFFPGLLIPMYRATGELVSHQWKPSAPVANRDGKRMKYASVKGQASVIDVHPRWSYDRGRDDPALVPAIRDIDIPLWITEGVKKADSLTSRDLCTIGLAGVYNWRTTMGSLGDWEDIPLKGRSVRVVFDSDAWGKPGVLQAMVRLGRWLKSKLVAEVVYIIVPTSWNGRDTKGIDDFFAAGGTLDDLRQFSSTAPPVVANTDDAFTDSRMAETVGDEVLCDRYTWCRELGWLAFTGQKWQDVSDVTVTEDIRVWTLDQFAEAANEMRNGRVPAAHVDGWRSMLSASRLKAAVGLSRGRVEISYKQLDADPEVFNAANGMLDLTRCTHRPSAPSDYVTKVAGASFDPRAQSPLWEAFLERILPDPETRGFVQRLFGYSMLGVVREHVLPIFTGEGANGKGTLRDTVLAAFGDYAIEVDPALLMESKHDRHGTFKMRLRGARLVFCSETEKNRRFSEATMKRLTGGDPIEANLMHKDPITFDPSHTLVMITNDLPVVSGDDPAAWRRIRVVPFDVVIPELERDGTLPERLREPHVLAAVLAWCVQGYVEYLRIGLAAPDAVKIRTDAYHGESDLFGRFLTDKVVFGEHCSEMASTLFKGYSDWCAAERVTSVSQTEFGKQMTRRNYVSVKRGGQKLYQGLMLIKDEEDARPGWHH